MRSRENSTKLWAFYLAVMTFLIVSTVVGEINPTGTWTSENGEIFDIKQLGNSINGSYVGMDKTISIRGTNLDNVLTLNMHTVFNGSQSYESILTLKIVSVTELNVISNSNNSIGGQAGENWTRPNHASITPDAPSTSNAVFNNTP